MSKQIIATNQAQQEELNQEGTPQARPEGNDKAITTYQEKKVIYEKRLDFEDKRKEEEIDIMDYRKVDLQKTAELKVFFKENIDARSLDLSGNPLDSSRSTAITLEYLKAATNLTDLNLSSCSAHTYPWGKGVSKFLMDNTSLTSLNLSNSDLRGAVAKALSKALKINSTLTILNLSDNNIRGIDDIKVLAKALENNSALTSLNLSNNSVGGVTDAEAFANMLKIKALLI